MTPTVALVNTSGAVRRTSEIPLGDRNQETSYRRHGYRPDNPSYHSRDDCSRLRNSVPLHEQGSAGTLAQTGLVHEVAVESIRRAVFHLPR